MQSTEEESKSKSTTHSTRREDALTRRALSFYVYTEREKETTTQPTPKAKPQSQESKTKSRKAGKAGSQAGEQAKAGQEDKEE